MFFQKLGPDSVPGVVYSLLIATSFFVVSTSQLAIVGLLFFLVPIYSVTEKKYPISVKFFTQTEILILITLLAYVLLSVLWSDITDQVFIYKEVARVAIVCGLVIATASLNMNILKNIDLIFILSFSLAAILLFLDPELYENSAHGYVMANISGKGILYHHSPLSWMAATTIILCINRLLSGSSLSFIAPVLLSLLVMVLAQSRAGYLALTFGVIVLCLYRNAYLKYFFVLLVCIVLLFLALYLSTESTWIKSLILRKDASRWHIYALVWDSIKLHPFFGHGFFADSSVVLPGKFTAMHSHNMYLSTWFYGGIVGVVLFCSLIMSFLIKCWRLPGMAQWYSVVTMGLLIFVFDGNHFISYPSGELYIFLLPVIICVAMRSRINEKFAE